MSSFGAPVDSFHQYERLYSLLYQPLSEVQKIFSGIVINFKYTLGDHIQALKGEIRKNCQAHSKSRDSDIYLRSIKSKLKEDLLNHLLGTEVDPEYEGIPVYPNFDRNSLDDEFIREIKASFRSIFKFIDDLSSGVTITSPVPAVQVKGKEKRTISIPASFKLSSDIDKTSFFESFHRLSGKFVGEDTTDEQFMACFSGGPVSTKVLWKRQNALYYYIKQLNQRNIIEKIPNGIWETAALCFIDKTVKPLDPVNLGKTKPPKGNKCTEIDDAIDLIKKNT